MGKWLPDGVVDPRWFFGRLSPKSKDYLEKRFTGVEGVRRIREGILEKGSFPPRGEGKGDIPLLASPLGVRGRHGGEVSHGDIGFGNDILPDLLPEVLRSEDVSGEEERKSSEKGLDIDVFPFIFSYLLTRIRTRIARTFIRGCLGRVIEKPLKPYIKLILIELFFKMFLDFKFKGKNNS